MKCYPCEVGNHEACLGPEDDGCTCCYEAVEYCAGCGARINQDYGRCTRC